VDLCNENNQLGQWHDESVDIDGFQNRQHDRMWGKNVATDKVNAVVYVLAHQLEQAHQSSDDIHNNCHLGK
jgi:hypothetical protein